MPISHRPIAHVFTAINNEGVQVRTFFGEPVRRTVVKVVSGFAFIMVVTLAYQLARGESGADAPVPAGTSVRADFDKMMSVLTHRRCVNCHPSDDRPRQGEDSHVHRFGVRRGTDNHGLPALRCEACHVPDNNPHSGVPGAPEWSLAPSSMAWQGLSRVEIARSMLDPERNGNRDPESVMHHLTEHALVLWAWTPGVDAGGRPREPPPVPKDEYIEAVKRWFAAGAPIPEE